MTYEWDENKRRANLEKHGVDFASVEFFEWEAAAISPDLRRDYPEPRFIAIGLIANRLHVLVFSNRGDETRIISIRKANKREVKRYEKTL